MTLCILSCHTFQPSPTEGVGQNVPSVVKQALLVLETITRACPALLTALILSARLKFITGDIKGAAASLKHVLENIGQLSFAAASPFIHLRCA